MLTNVGTDHATHATIAIAITATITLAASTSPCVGLDLLTSHLLSYRSIPRATHRTTAHPPICEMTAASDRRAAASVGMVTGWPYFQLPSAAQTSPCG